MKNLNSKIFIILISALIAAFVSVLNVILNIRSSRSTKKTDAMRSILQPDIHKIGLVLYQIIAVSKKMLDAKTDNSFHNFRIISDRHRKELDILRTSMRYGLWGLDEGLREIRSVPFYITHYKNDRQNNRAKKIILLGTSLRLSLDKAIVSVYISGLPANIIKRMFVSYYIWRLRRCFKKGHP